MNLFIDGTISPLCRYCGTEIMFSRGRKYQIIYLNRDGALHNCEEKRCYQALDRDSTRQSIRESSQTALLRMLREGPVLAHNLPCSVNTLHHLNKTMAPMRIVSRKVAVQTKFGTITEREYYLER